MRLVFTDNLQDAPSALKAIYQLVDQMAPHILLSEIRTVAAGELWLSPCYQRASVVFGFSWQPDEPQVMKRLCSMVEKVLEPFEPRPHWGKLFCMESGDVRRKYDRINDFQRMVEEEYDPDGKFRNEFLDRYIFSNVH